MGASTRSTIESPGERSRNAKAQARHRAKRKAYISHLEHTVARLSGVGGLEVHAEPGHPSSRVKDLETQVLQLRLENDSLRDENERLREQIAERGTSPVSDPESSPTFAKRPFPTFSSDAPFSTAPGHRIITGLNLTLGGPPGHSPSTIPSQSSPLSRPLFGDSRTSSHGSLSSVTGHTNGYYSFAHAGYEHTASPTTTSSSSPFSATASPPTLPGLKLPPSASPRSTWNGQLSAGPETRGSPFVMPSPSSYNSSQPRAVLPPLQRTTPTAVSPSTASPVKGEAAPVSQLHYLYQSTPTYTVDSYGVWQQPRSR